MQPSQPSMSSQPNNISRPTFADKLQKKIQPLTNFDHPTEEQGLIFDHQEGAKIREYLLAIYQLVGGASNILAASRVSGGRVIIFLATKDLVDNFQQNYGGFNFCNTFIKTRKLKAPATKLIISNVSPTIPNTVLEKKLKDFKLNLVSPISLLRVNPKDDLFPHVISSRRQVYIHSTDNKPTFPSSFLLPFAERTYRIYLNADSMTCFKCSSRGHKAEDCPQVMDEESEDEYEITDDKISDKNRSLVDYPPLPSILEKPLNPVSMDINFTQLPNISESNKRGPSTLNSSGSNTMENEPVSGIQPSKLESTPPIKLVQMKNSQSNHLAKRQKTTDTPRPPLILTPEEIAKINQKFESILTNKPIDCHLSAKDFITFLPASRNSPNKLDFAKSLTSDLPSLLFILDEVKPLVSSGAKKTITALAKAIRGQDAATSPNHSDTE